MPAMARHDYHPHPAHHCPVHQEKVVCMSSAATPEQMDRIVEYIKGISFDSDKLKAAKLIVSVCPIRSCDLVRIIEIFGFDDNRMEVLIAAYPYCPDPEHFHRAVEKLSFMSNREKVYQSIDRMR